MYEAFFNLRKKPFELVPDPDFIYMSRSHRKALIYLDYGIKERAGFILLTGEVGSGKTTLIRDLLDKRYERVVVAKVFNTRVTSEQLLAMINDDFGLPVQGKDKISLMRDLNDFLLEQYAAGNQPVLIIDEAQNLAADLLEEIRMLSNLESSHGKLLQIVLVGQPELRETLAAPELLQLRQRISVNCHLKALSRPETAEYIAHRMAVAGNPQAVEFPAETLDMIFQYSRGIPRLINIMCDFLMLAAFAEEVRSVSPEIARDVIGDLDFESHFWGDGFAPSPEAIQEGGNAQRQAQPDPALLQIAQRVDDLEGGILQLPKALKEVHEAMLELRKEVGAQAARTEERVAKLQREFAVIATAPEETVETKPESLSAAALARRIWYGMSGQSGKR